MKPTVAIDLDDTLVDYSGKLKTDYELIKHPCEPEFNRADNGSPWFEARRHMITNQPGWWLDLPILSLGADLYGLIKNLDCNIIIVTKGSEGKDGCWSEKHQWCRRYLGDNVDVCVTTNKHFIKADLLIDDWPMYFEPWLEANPGKNVICPVHEGNADYINSRVLMATTDNIKTIETFLNNWRSSV